MNCRQKLTRVPQRYAGRKGEHVNEQQQYGGRPTRRRKPSYRMSLVLEWRVKNNQRPGSCRHISNSELKTSALTDVRKTPEDTTYAIAHASTALLIKRRFPRVGLWPLLISVQFVELLWVLFTYLGIEHAQVTPNAVHLDFLPYSHSVGTGLLLAAIAWGFGKVARRSNVGAAIALGVLSHVALDIIQHEPNITL